ncbi:MAG TPA: FAD-dependent oxidoreductase [Thermoanaerobaculia bacterium]|jgi:NADH:ubiquinone reductase (non-electrogenic)|nr:FAD-dependent oxidoreductase [Thermoanaerobaculia bacterium]
MAPPKLVILGSGFGGYSLSRNLPRDLFDTTVVSPRNYFVFTPLLPSAVAGSVELRSILEPVRRRVRSARMVEAAAERVDWEARAVHCRSAVSDEQLVVPFDLLAIAVGAALADYGIPGVAEHALSLQDVGDAREIRGRVLLQLARADLPGLTDEEVRRRLTFVVCGGGATGVEIAAEVHDLLDEELREVFPRIARLARVVLLEAAPRLLGGFDAALAEYTSAHFLRGGIEVRTSTPVARVEADRVVLADGSEVPYGMVVWAGGLAPRPFVRALGLPLDERGRLVIDRCLRLVGRSGAFALGDCAACPEAPVPATAQVAQQQGKYLARSLRLVASGRPAREFDFRNLGMLAYIGGRQALADLPHVRWSGRAAWLFWRSVYLTKLVSLANKVKVLFDWAKAAAFGRDTSRF